MHHRLKENLRWLQEQRFQHNLPQVDGLQLHPSPLGPLFTLPCLEEFTRRKSLRSVPLGALQAENFSNKCFSQGVSFSLVTPPTNKATLLQNSLPSLCSFPCGSTDKETLHNVGDPDPWVGKIPWRRERLPPPVFWPEEFHGLYSPWARKESDTTEWLSRTHEACEGLTAEGLVSINSCIQ